MQVTEKGEKTRDTCLSHLQVVFDFANMSTIEFAIGVLKKVVVGGKRDKTLQDTIDHVSPFLLSLVGSLCVYRLVQKN